MSTHERIPISEEEFRHAWHSDRAHNEHKKLAKAEELRLSGMLYDATSITDNAINQLEHIAELEICRKAIAKACTIYALIGTHTAEAYHLDRFLGDKLNMIEKFNTSLDPNDEVDSYFLELNYLIPHFVAYLKGRFNQARVGIRDLVDNLTDIRVKAYALRNLIVTTAICYGRGESTIDDYEDVQKKIEIHKKELRIGPSEQARMLEGCARSLFILSQSHESRSSCLEKAAIYIEQARENISLLLHARTNPPALVEIQIARTRLEMSVGERPVQIDKIKEMITNLAQSIRPGFDRYWEESRRLAMLTGEEELVSFEYKLRMVNRR